MNYNLNHLKYFITLADTLSFSECAKQLSVAQPSVSKAIKNLESVLNTQLFHRSNKNVKLTEHGKKLYLQTKDVINSIENSLSNLSENSDLEGTIKVGSFIEFAELKLAPLIAEFIKQNPAINIELKLLSNNELDKELKDGHLDFIFGLTPISDENIKSFHLLTQESFLITSSKTTTDEKFRPAESPFVFYRDNDPLIKEYLKKFHPKQSMSKISKKLTTPSHHIMIETVKHNPGVYTIVPEYSNAFIHALENKQIIKISNQSIQSPIYISYRDLEFKSQKLELFKNFMQENI